MPVGGLFVPQLAQKPAFHPAGDGVPVVVDQSLSSADQIETGVHPEYFTASEMRLQRLPFDTTRGAHDCSVGIVLTGHLLPLRMIKRAW